MLLSVAILVLTANAISASTTQQRQDLLDGHNKYRAALALGKVSGQPAAADMTLMDYDTEVEAKAEVWNRKCIAGHDGAADRLVKKAGYELFSYIGQNWAGFSGPVIKACDMWWNEYKDYSYNSNDSPTNQAVGHYTQMSWSKSTVLGCSVSPCPTYGQHITCNYGFGGNFNGEKPYIAGTACSKCPDGYIFCFGGALCARPDQCGGSNCKCAMKSCDNGGSLDSQNCVCKCATDFYGDRCQYKCQDTHSSCPYVQTKDCTKSYWNDNCRKKCNNCKITKPFITQARGSIVSRIQ